MLKLNLNPTDVLLFRDGRAFNAGQAQNAQTLMPPPPRTIYGALRALIMSHGEENSLLSYSAETPLTEPVERYAGTAKELGALEIGPVFFTNTKTGEELFPTPADVAIAGQSESQQVVMSGPKEGKKTSNIRSNLPTGLALVWQNEQTGKTDVPKYITKKGMDKYLQLEQLVNSTSQRDFADEASLYIYENRTGIKIGESRAAEEHYLYSVNFARVLGDVRISSYVFNEQLPEFVPKKGLLKLGGENKSAGYELVEERIPEIPERLKKTIEETKRFKLVLMSPAYFKAGTTPDFVRQEEKNMRGELGGKPVRLVGVCTNGSQQIGGYSIVRTETRGNWKKRRKYVQVGTVYYFEADELDVEALFKQCWWKSVQQDENLRKEGFGYTIIGSWNYV